VRNAARRINSLKRAFLPGYLPLLWEWGRRSHRFPFDEALCPLEKAICKNLIHRIRVSFFVTLRIPCAVQDPLKAVAPKSRLLAKRTIYVGQECQPAV